MLAVGEQKNFLIHFAQLKVIKKRNKYVSALSSREISVNYRAVSGKVYSEVINSGVYFL